MNRDAFDISADLNKGIPVVDNAVDNAILAHILEHVENSSQPLSETYRILHPDGTATVEVPNTGWLPVRLHLTHSVS